MKEHQKIRVGATLHTALLNLRAIEAVLEQSSDFHEIVYDDVPPLQKTAIRAEVRELRRIIETMFERFALSPSEISRKRSVAVHAALTVNDFYDLITRFQEAYGVVSEDEARALHACCAAIDEHLERIINIT